jgi:hypothetical protein
MLHQLLINPNQQVRNTIPPKTSKVVFKGVGPQSNNGTKHHKLALKDILLPGGVNAR